MAGIVARRLRRRMPRRSSTAFYPRILTVGFRRPGCVPPAEHAPGLASRASDTTGQTFMTQRCQFENRLSPSFRIFSGWTVRRIATSREPSKTSSTLSQTRQ